MSAATRVSVEAAVMHGGTLTVTGIRAEQGEGGGLLLSEEEALRLSGLLAEAVGVAERLARYRPEVEQ